MHDAPYCSKPFYTYGPPTWIWSADMNLRYKTTWFSRSGLKHAKPWASPDFNHIVLFNVKCWVPAPKIYPSLGIGRIKMKHVPLNKFIESNGHKQSSHIAEKDQCHQQIARELHLHSDGSTKIEFEMRLQTPGMEYFSTSPSQWEFQSSSVLHRRSISTKRHCTLQSWSHCILEQLWPIEKDHWTTLYTKYSGCTVSTQICMIYTIGKLLSIEIFDSFVQCRLSSSPHYLNGKRGNSATSGLVDLIFHTDFSSRTLTATIFKMYVQWNISLPWKRE